MSRAVAAVALFSLLVLGVRARNAGMAGGYIDPVSRIDAQDEALYAHSALRMAKQGGWLTPMFLGRYGLYKPPLAAWLAGASVKLAGVSALALRAPALAAAALAACLVFAWSRRLRSAWAGAAAALLLVSSHLWQTVAGMCLTDGLLAAAITAAVYSLFRDPRLERRASLWVFAIATAAGVLAKSVAGATPLLILLAFAALSPVRPRASRMLGCALLTAALAAPWFLYQAVVHSRWFWAEHIGLEIFAFGTGAPPQTSGEDHLLFYLRRAWALDPMLAIAAAIALPSLAAALRRKRAPEDVLLACWMAVVISAPLLWSYRNLAYLLPLLPALAILAAAYGPSVRHARIAAAVLIAVLAVKAAVPDRPWSLDFGRGTKALAATALSDYCRRARPNELILVEVQDAFYSALLPLPRVRYCYIAPDVPAGRYRLDFRSMGIMVTAGEFAALDTLRPRYLEQLREWGLDSAAPVATVVLAATVNDLAALIRHVPESDLLVPKALLEAIGPGVSPAHDLQPAPGDFAFLLSRTAPARPEPPAAGCCEL